MISIFDILRVLEELNTHARRQTAEMNPFSLITNGEFWAIKFLMKEVFTGNVSADIPWHSKEDLKKDLILQANDVMNVIRRIDFSKKVP